MQRTSEKVVLAEHIDKGRCGARGEIVLWPTGPTTMLLDYKPASGEYTARARMTKGPARLQIRQLRMRKCSVADVRAGAGGAGRAPVVHGLQDRGQAVALLGQLVLDVRRDRAVIAAGHQTVGLELAQPL